MNVVYFVDDERGVLDGLRRMLRDMRDSWRMEFFDAPANALAAMASLPPDVVVSDMRMPQMDGAAFLAEVQRRCPAAARIVLSGHAELAALAQVMPIAHQLLSKPCDPERLRALLRNLAMLRARFRDPRIAAAIGGIGALPSIPEVLRQILDALDRTDADQRVIGALIAKDPGLSVRLLQVANSGYFGLRQHVDSVEQAVVMIGARMLRCLILQVKLVEAFPTRGSRFSPAEFGRAIAVKALLARQLIEEPCSTDRLREAILAADLGQLILASRSSREYDAVLDAFTAGDEDLVVVEARMLGVTHADVGALLMGLWGENADVVDLVARHHDHGALAAGSLAHAIYLSEMLVACRNDVARLARRLPRAAAAYLTDRAPLEQWVQRAEQVAQTVKGSSAA